MARVAGRGKVGDLNTRDQSRGKCRALARRRNRHRRRLLRVDREHFRGLELAGREEESARSQRESQGCHWAKAMIPVSIGSLEVRKFTIQDVQNEPASVPSVWSLLR